MRRLILVATLSLLSLSTSLIVTPVLAAYGRTGQSVGCGASVSTISFAGECVGVQGPSSPTVPAYWHHWVMTYPVAPPVCDPYDTVEWAAAATPTSPAGGAVWTQGGQRVPVIYSTPRTDNGWTWEVNCTGTEDVRFIGVTSEPRAPNPCATATPAPSCIPGFSGAKFLAAVQGEVPNETIAAYPADVGLVGVPVTVSLSPVPITESAEIDVSTPDAGDQDPGEIIHVVWIVQAVPESVEWSWPDGTRTVGGQWIPQVYVSRGPIEAQVVYDVSATGFWSDGVTVHRLSTQTVGTIDVGATISYSVEQVQPALG